MPTSMPMIEVVGCTGAATSRSVWIDTNHLPPVQVSAIGL